MKCTAITTKGDRCKRNATIGVYCNLHNKLLLKDTPLNIQPKVNKQKINNEKELIEKSEFEIKCENIGFSIIGECPICNDNIYDINDTKLKCDHKICIKCVKKLRDPRCPLCRCDIESGLITKDDIKEITKRYEEDNNIRNNISSEDYQREEYQREDYEDSSEDEELNNGNYIISRIEAFLRENNQAQLGRFNPNFIEDYIESIAVLTGLPIEEVYEIIS